MSQLLDSLLTPAQLAQAERIDAAMVQLSGLLAERAVLQTATAALDVSRRAAFQAIHRDEAPTKFPTHDTLDPEYLMSQIVECREALDAASKALCGWHGQIKPERARELMTHAAAFLAEE